MSLSAASADQPASLLRQALILRGASQKDVRRRHLRGFAVLHAILVLAIGQLLQGGTVLDLHVAIGRALCL